MNWDQVFDQEITNAKQARLKGNEAMARVCARRAANAIVHEFLFKMGQQPFRSSVQNFRYLQRYLPVDHPAQKALSHLLLKVNPDFSFPDEIDLIQESYRLRDILLENK